MESGEPVLITPSCKPSAAMVPRQPSSAVDAVRVQRDAPFVQAAQQLGLAALLISARP